MPHEPTSRGASSAAAASVLEALRESGLGPRRREDGKDVPIGARGARTRQRLLDAAGEVFAEHGYQASTIAMISDRAQVSLGTFYQYFRDRSDVINALVTSYAGRLLDDEAGLAWDVHDGRPGLRRLLRGYARAYAGTAGFSKVWEEVTQTDPEFAEVRRTLTRLIEGQLAGQIAAGDAAGLLRAPADPGLVARALAAMTDRFCYLTYVVDPSDPPLAPEQAADVLTALWVSTLQLVDGPA
ncbi:MAG: TetR/AcrR family transcriptional regulator [Frankiales bacterium]|jgi:AcrR family transcriptional regulator|nr:TetR/AcrR family transcriptional regulator [Frankiales bacterium]